MIDLINIGIPLGLVYAGVAVGFTIVYRAGRVFNVALGQFVLVGLLVFMWLYERFDSVVIATVGTSVLMALLGFVVAKFLFQRLVAESDLALFLATLGLLLVLDGLVVLIFGGEMQLFPNVLPTSTLDLGDSVVRVSDLLSAFIVVTAIGGLHLFFERTRAGLVYTAVAEDHQVAQSMGISVKRALVFAWMLAGAITIIAVITYGQGRNITPSVSHIGFIAIPVVLLAGLQSLGGLLLAGIVVGVGEVAASTWLDPHFEGGASVVFPYVLMLLVLLIRPEGLFGWKRIERL